MVDDDDDCEDRRDRLGLVRKIYGIMSTQLLITALMTLLPYMNEGIRQAMLGSPGLVMITAIGGLVLSYCIFCVESLAKTVPTNYILMFAFTVCEAYTVSFIAATVGDGLLVIQAAFLTAGLVVGLTLYAMTTKTDFTVFGALLWGVGTLFLLFSLFSVFFGPTMRLIYCVLGVLLFSFYLIYDTQLIIGGEDHYAKIGNDDYILGAIILYLDIINLFIYILQILSSNKD